MSSTTDEEVPGTGSVPITAPTVGVVGASVAGGIGGVRVEGIEVVTATKGAVGVSSGGAVGMGVEVVVSVGALVGNAVGISVRVSVAGWMVGSADGAGDGSWAVRVEPASCATDVSIVAWAACPQALRTDINSRLINKDCRDCFIFMLLHHLQHS